VPDFRLVAVSDVSGGYYRHEGLDIPKMLQYAREHQFSLQGYTEAERMSNEDLLDQVDVYRGIRRQIHDAHAVEAHVQENAMVAELQVRVHQADPPVELFVERWPIIWKKIRIQL